MGSHKRFWMLCAAACALVFSMFGIQAINALSLVEQSVIKTGSIRLVSIDTQEKTSRSAPRRHTANLLLKANDFEAELLKFPNQAYQSTDHKELMNEVQVLIKQTSIEANCTSSLKACYVHACAATSTKAGLLISFSGFTVFALFALNARRRKEKLG